MELRLCHAKLRTHAIRLYVVRDVSCVTKVHILLGNGIYYERKANTW